MALAPNGKKRITLTISFPSMAKMLVKHGYCVGEGLGKFTLTADGKVEFTADDDLYAEIDDAREIAQAEAKLERELQEEREQRAHLKR